MSWPTNPRPAKTLLQIRKQIDQMYPGRDKSSDGMLGDAAHSARTSDHNPDDDHVVKAIDISHDPKVGFNSYKFAREVLAVNKDPRIKYVISNRQIMSGSGQSNPAWKWRSYSGSNPHDQHVHISVKPEAKYYDDVSEWDFGREQQPNPELPDNPWIGKRLLVRGSVNDDVKLLQEKLGLKPADGIFGKLTEAAVKTFQARNGLEADGKVGVYTWKALYTVSQDVPPPVVDPSLPPVTDVIVTPVVEVDVNEIAAIAQTSAIAHYNWGGRGAAPIGYIKGMAVMYAVMVQKLSQGNPAAVEMAKPMKPGNDNKDALAHYSEELRAKGLPTEEGGLGTLRALFTLMLGLGMRESSGKYCEGRDTTAVLAVSADTAEAGLFQSSYDLRAASPLIDRLLDAYQGLDGYRSTFAEGVKCTAKNLENYGSGRGELFQKTSKEKPGFAVEACGVGLRNLRRHWGPINRKEAEIVGSAILMFRDVESAITTPVQVATPVAQMRGAARPASTVDVEPPARELTEEEKPVARKAAMSGIVWPIIRYALIAVGMWMAGRGIVKGDMVPKIVDELGPQIGAIIAAVSAMWGIYVTYGTRPVPIETAMRKDVPTVSPATGQRESGPDLADKAST